MIDIINSLKSPWNIIAWIGYAIFLFVVLIVLLKLNQIIFKRLQKKRNMNLLFFQHINSVIIVVVFIVVTISSFSGFQSAWQTILGGTAIISAVIAFAAQDVLKDIIAGIMLSIHKPFRIGDRIALENGLSGIVEEMTISYVVIKTMDTTRQIVPNSKIHSSRIVNLSYNRKEHSTELEFSISYTSDMPLAKRLIEDAIKKSKYTIPGIYDKDGNLQYAEANFIRFDSSALIIHTTIYFESTTPHIKLIDDINVRVREALIANNIEIPYNYLNVITDSNESEPEQIKKINNIKQNKKNNDKNNKNNKDNKSNKSKGKKEINKNKKTKKA